MEIFYKKGGPHRGPKGVPYGYTSAEKCPVGYFKTLDEALADKPAKKKPVKKAPVKEEAKEAVADFINAVSSDDKDS